MSSTVAPSQSIMLSPKFISTVLAKFPCIRLPYVLGLNSANRTRPRGTFTTLNSCVYALTTPTYIYCELRHKRLCASCMKFAKYKRIKRQANCAAGHYKKGEFVYSGIRLIESPVKWGSRFIGPIVHSRNHSGSKAYKSHRLFGPIIGFIEPMNAEDYYMINFKEGC